MNSQVTRIEKLYTDLHHGDSWIGTNFKDALHGITATIAAAKPFENCNSIWQLVSHVIYWRTKVTNRIHGNNNPPPFIDFRLPEEMDEDNWKRTIHDFESAYHQLRNAIHTFKDEHLDKPSPKEGQTYYQLMIGCLEHDAYHLGQIILLKKVCGL